MRLIDADALHESISKEIETYYSSANGGYYLAEDTLEEIKNAPTIEPKPEYIDNSLIIRHYSNGMIAMNEECFKRLDSQPKLGEWIYGIDPDTSEKDLYAWTCSECGEKYPWQPNFCPNCGADMRGEDE